jgi:serine/threonine protein kinase
MNAEAWARVKSLLADAADLPAPDRERFVVERCPDPELRREVLELLLSPAPLSDIIAAGTLKAGARLGPYVIERLLGAGGMGEVFRARDTTLGRDVAIKILPRIFATDPHRLARFRREAQVLASLNHPHIGAIYGVEEADGVPALVLELVEGDTLADRIAGFVREAPSYRYLAAGEGLQAPEARGQKPGRPLPILDAMNVARQVAEALEAAHERGIIHRDLKPANIKITPEGVVKVLDFGLAKIGDGAGPDLSQEPNVGGTREGLILGTPAYMSPEQARGLAAVDKRTDIWAFGCVCYEMLAGRAAFVGETLTDTLAAVVQREPDWLALPNGTPSAVRRLLQRCLEKDPRRRLRDIGDVRLDIEEALTAPAPSQTVQAPSSVRRWPSHVAWALVALSIVAVIGALGGPYILGTRASDGQPVRFTIGPPLNSVLPSNIQAGISALSPDGRRLAFVADRAGTRLLWVRSLDSLEVRLLPGTEGAESPFWSPDNQTVAFAAQGKLKAIDAAGGSVHTLCDEPGDSYGGSWSPEGTIVFATLQRGLSSVPSNGGAPTTLPSPDAPSGEMHLFPRFLPDGRHFVYLSVPSNVAWLASLDSREGIVRLLNANSQIQYIAPGYLVFVRRGTLMAQRFDGNAPRSWVRPYQSWKACWRETKPTGQHLPRP